MAGKLPKERKLPKCTPGKSYNCGKICLSIKRMCRLDPQAKPEKAEVVILGGLLEATEPKALPPAKEQESELKENTLSRSIVNKNKVRTRSVNPDQQRKALLSDTEVKNLTLRAADLRAEISRRTANLRNAGGNISPEDLEIASATLKKFNQQLSSIEDMLANNRKARRIDTPRPKGAGILGSTR